MARAVGRPYVARFTVYGLRETVQWPVP